MKKLPPKSPLPSKGGTFHWRERYFDIGEVIKWMDHDGKRHFALVEKVKRNNYGRVSYETYSRLVLTEDVARALDGKAVF